MTGQDRQNLEEDAHEIHSEFANHITKLLDLIEERDEKISDLEDQISDLEEQLEEMENP